MDFRFTLNIHCMQLCHVTALWMLETICCLSSLCASVHQMHEHAVSLEAFFLLSAVLLSPVCFFA